MRIYINLFFLGLLFLTACKPSGIPDDVIPQQKMTNLLTEVHIADGTLYAVVQNPDSLYKYGISRYQALFKKYGTDTTQFKKSMAFYTAKPELLEVMYDDITKIIAAKTDSLNKLRDKMAAVQADSLRKIKRTFRKPNIDSIKNIRNKTTK